MRNKTTFAKCCLTQWISKFPVSFEIHWVRQYLVNFTGLARIVNAPVYKAEPIFLGMASCPNFWYYYTVQNTITILSNDSYILVSYAKSVSRLPDILSKQITSIYISTATIVTWIIPYAQPLWPKLSAAHITDDMICIDLTYIPMFWTPNVYWDPHGYIMNSRKYRVLLLRVFEHRTLYQTIRQVWKSIGALING